MEHVNCSQMEQLQEEWSTRLHLLQEELDREREMKRLRPEVKHAETSTADDRKEAATNTKDDSSGVWGRTTSGFGGPVEQRDGFGGPVEQHDGHSSVPQFSSSFIPHTPLPQQVRETIWIL